MEVPDKTWMSLRRDHSKYEEGVDQFLEYAVSRTGRQNLKCPCVKCLNITYNDIVDVKTHLIVYGINLNYHFWYFHGEKMNTTNAVYDDDDDNEEDDEDDQDDVVDDETVECDDVVPDVVPEVPNTVPDPNNTVNEEQYMQDFIHDMFSNVNAGPSNHEPNEDAQKFFKLLDDSKQPLYEGARITKSSALLKLLHIKNVGQWTNASFDMLLRLLTEDILPMDAQLPNSYYECKKFIIDIGMKYDKIDACNNNCMLFWKDDMNLQSCRVTFLDGKSTKQVRQFERSKMENSFP